MSHPFDHLEAKIARAKERAELERKKAGPKQTPQHFERDDHQHDGTVKVVSHPVRPPLGARPRMIARAERLEEIGAAIDRYELAGLDVPQEWLDELGELLTCDPLVRNELLMTMHTIRMGRPFDFRKMARGRLSGDFEIQPEFRT